MYCKIKTKYFYVVTVYRSYTAITVLMMLASRTVKHTAYAIDQYQQLYLGLIRKYPEEL